MGTGEALLLKGSLQSAEENRMRKEVLRRFRGYPDRELFRNFPTDIRRFFARFEQGDIDRLFYMDYSYWNELSSGTRKPAAAAENIQNGLVVYGVSNQPALSGVEYLKKHAFPPVILLTCGNGKFLILEGHSRMTVYGLAPEFFPGSFGYIGCTTSEQMRRYDPWMAINPSR